MTKILDNTPLTDGKNDSVLSPINVNAGFKYEIDLD